MEEILNGQLVEVGDMDDGESGFVLAFRGEQIRGEQMGMLSIAGLDVDSVIELGKLLYRDVIVTITVVPKD